MMELCQRNRDCNPRATSVIPPSSIILIRFPEANCRFLTTMLVSRHIRSEEKLRTRAYIRDLFRNTYLKLQNQVVQALVLKEASNRLVSSTALFRISNILDKHRMGHRPAIVIMSIQETIVTVTRVRQRGRQWSHTIGNLHNTLDFISVFIKWFIATPRRYTIVKIDDYISTIPKMERRFGFSRLISY